jgi:DNA polymerase III, delta subunit
MKNIDDDIKTKKFHKVYLIFGDEKYLTLQYENKLKSAIVSKDAELINTSSFDGISNIEQVSSAIETLPFFSDYRLVTIKDSGLFKIGKKDMTDKMVEIIKNMPETTVVIFSNEDIDKRNSLYKTIKKYGYICEINKLKDTELVKWVEKYSEGKVKGSLAAYFVQNIGTSLETINSELDKLISYCTTESITKENIDNICTKSLESNMFDMIDAIGNKQADKALEIYNNMLVMKQSPVAVLTMIARQFKLILECKYLLRKNYSKSQIAFELSQREFIVDKYMKQSKNFSLATLMAATKDCAELDVKFKQGLITDVLGVEMIILKYSKK